MVMGFFGLSLAKGAASKIMSALAAIGVIMVGVAWWRAAPETRDMILSATGRGVAWLGIVGLLPWVSFPVIGWVARFERNSAGAALIASYTILEVLLLGWMFNWSVNGTFAWSLFILGSLLAAAYNLFACDWIAEKVEG
jgi:hypothetical protein